MEVVVEWVILDNFCIDSLILLGTNKILKQAVNWWGITIAALLGAIFALIMPMVNLSGLSALLIKLGFAYIMCVISSFSFKRAFYRFITFTFLTFCFGGALVAIFTYLNISTQSGITLNYVSSLPMGAIISLGLVFILFLVKLVSKVVLNAKNSVLCNITFNGKSKVLRGFIDSGNLLHSSLGKPVAVIEEKTLSNWLNPNERMALIMDKFDSLKLDNAERIDVNSLGQVYKMTIFDATIQIGKRVKAISLGISYHKIRANNCEVVLGSNILEV